MTNAKEVVVKKDAAMKIVDWLKPALKSALPRHLTPDRMARVILTEFRRNPQLLNCSRESLAGAILTAAQVGLEPGVVGQCWLIPYGKEATFVPGYQGLIELAYRSGQLDYITAEVVREKDFFEYSLGTELYIKHKPAEGERGELKYVYAVARLKNAQTPIFKVLTRKEVEKVKKSSKSGHSSFSPWQTWEEEMWKKTALKRLLKLLPKSVEMLQVLEAEIQAESLETPEMTIEVPPTPAESQKEAKEAEAKEEVKHPKGQEKLHLGDIKE